MTDIEKVRDANTAEEMRAEILRLRRYNPIVRAIMDMADYEGMSAEDRFTILAYNALHQNATLQSLVFEYSASRAMPAMPAITVRDTDLSAYFWDEIDRVLAS